MLLESNIMSANTWIRLRGGIIDSGSEVDCKPILDWLWVSLTWNIRDDQPFPLTMNRTTTPIMGGDILRHCHHILVCHPPGQDTALQQSQGSLIATHIGEVAVYLQQDRE